MENKAKDTSLIEQAGDDLFNFAVDRQDVKTLIAHLHDEVQCKPATIEYELQILTFSPCFVIRPLSLKTTGSSPRMASCSSSAERRVPRTS